jgi:hypothetical protein
MKTGVATSTLSPCLDELNSGLEKGCQEARYMLGLTHRPTDEICSSRVDPGEVLQFKNGPKTSTGALTDQLQTWYFIIITGHLLVT